MRRGAIYAVVKAAAGRGAAGGTHRLTGYWPGGNAEPARKAA